MIKSFEFPLFNPQYLSPTKRLEIIKRRKFLNAEYDYLIRMTPQELTKKLCLDISLLNSSRYNFYENFIKNYRPTHRRFRRIK